jgi:hypothetical protein
MIIFIFCHIGFEEGRGSSRCCWGTVVATSKASIKGGTPTADVEEPVQAVAREVLSLGAGAQKSREAASTSANPEV